MEILLLGPVELAVHGHPIELESDKVRCLIAALALEVGRAIPRDTLMDRLWDGDPPIHKDPLYSHVSRARKQLREAAAREGQGPHPGVGSAPGAPPVAPPGAPPESQPGAQGIPHIRRRSHTYMLTMIDPGSIDRHRFRELCEAARTASARGDDEQTVELLTQARMLWRGEPLAGLPGDWPEQVRRSLHREYLSAVVTGSAASLRLGRFEALVGELSEFVERNMNDEQLVSHLMLACHGSERHSDALRLYQRVRHVLRGMGTEPGAALARVYEGIVAGRPARELVREAVPGGSTVPVVVSTPGRGDGTHQDRSGPLATGMTGRTHTTSQAAGAPTTVNAMGSESPLSAASVAEPALPLGTHRPRMLPRQAPLEGRDAEFRELITAIDVTADRHDLARLVTISGMPGVGKTALAVRVAVQLADHFPHGELYVNLRGHDGSTSPLKPETAIGILLRGLGAPATSIPVDIHECAAMWQAMLTYRRCVIILDDAANAAQVAPMLLSDSASAVIVTSRRYLARLPEAHALTLEALAQKAAIALFRRLGGEERTQDIGEVTRIVRLCGYLPLAIELAAMRFHGRPTWKLSTLSERLARTPGRLGELRDMDDQRGIIRAFSMSYRTLGLEERRAFRLLCLHPGAGFSAEAAAQLLDMPLPQTERVLEALLSGSLLQEVTPNRHRFHDLLAEYASQLTQAEDSQSERDGAMTRLTSFFVRRAEQADRLAYPHRLEPAEPNLLPTGPLIPWEPTGEEARAWLEAEREALLAVERHARAQGAPERAAVLGQYLAAFLDAECHWDDAKTVAGHSAEHWRSVGHDRALCRALLSLTTAHGQMGEYAKAKASGEEALSLSQRSGDPSAEAEAFFFLSFLQWGIGEYRESLLLLEHAYALRPALGSIWGKARLENTLAATLLYLGDYARALEHFRKAVEGLRRSGDSRLLAKSLSNMGNLFKRLDRTDDARRCFEEALPLLKISGNSRELAGVNVSLADLVAESGDIASAISLHKEALDLFRMVGDKKNQANALIGMGELFQEQRRFGEAIECHLTALNIADGIGAAHEETVALRCLGVAEGAESRNSAAADHLRRAITLADRTHDRIEGVRSREALANVCLATDATDEALTLLGQAVDVMTGHSPDEVARLVDRIDQVRRRMST